MSSCVSAVLIHITCSEHLSPRQLKYTSSCITWQHGEFSVCCWILGIFWNKICASIRHYFSWESMLCKYYFTSWVISWQSLSSLAFWELSMIICNAQVICVINSKYFSAYCFSWLTWSIMGHFCLLGLSTETWDKLISISLFFFHFIIGIYQVYKFMS